MLGASLTDDARVVIYKCHMIKVKATGLVVMDATVPAALTRKLQL
jgi:hypothetical protein